jgi:hypothetical protein
VAISRCWRCRRRAGVGSKLKLLGIVSWLFLLSACWDHAAQQHRHTMQREWKFSAPCSLIGSYIVHMCTIGRPIPFNRYQPIIIVSPSSHLPLALRSILRILVRPSYTSSHLSSASDSATRRRRWRECRRILTSTVSMMQGCGEIIRTGEPVPPSLATNLLTRLSLRREGEGGGGVGGSCKYY